LGPLKNKASQAFPDLADRGELAKPTGAAHAADRTTDAWRVFAIKHPRPTTTTASLISAVYED